MYTVSKMHQTKDMEYKEVMRSEDMTYVMNFAFEMSSQEPEYIYKVERPNVITLVLRNGQRY